MRPFSSFSAALAALSIIGITSVASASSHREAPGISQDPVADNTDLWAWHTGNATTGTLHVVAAFNPLEEPAGGPNFHTFGDDVLYEVHVARGSKNLNDVVTYQIRFSTSALTVVDPADLAKPLGGGKEFFSQISGKKQTYTLTQVVNGVATELATGDVAPANIGPRTNQVAYQLAAPYDKAKYEALALGTAKSFGNGGKVWAGPRDDGFYVDLAGVFDLANLKVFTSNAQDNVAGYNCHAIAIDIPVASIPGSDATDTYNNRYGVWSSASRRKMSVLRNDGTRQNFGPWVQVSRLGIPLINEVIVGLQDKDRFNRTHPKDDVNNFGGYILNPVIVRDAEAVGIYAALNVPQATVDSLKTDRFDIVGAINIGDANFPLGASGDVLRVDFGSPAGFPNGRPLGPALNGGKNRTENDVTDTLVTLVLSGGAIALSDGVQSNDGVYTDTFPYLPTPWTGYDEGHGKAAPAQLSPCPSGTAREA